jgi:hypothetical protein
MNHARLHEFFSSFRCSGQKQALTWRPREARKTKNGLRPNARAGLKPYKKIWGVTLGHHSALKFPQGTTNVTKPPKSSSKSLFQI